MLLGMKHDLRESARSCPLTLALSPNTENGLGERELMVALAAQGATDGDGGPKLLPSLAWATF